MELVTVFPQNTDDEKECFDLLCRAYIEARYNKDYKITREQLEYLISRLEILKEMTERLCKEKIAEYNAMAENWLNTRNILKSYNFASVWLSLPIN